MKKWMRFGLMCLIAMCIFAPVGCGKHGSGGVEKLKLGFVVKQPEEPWFQLEWKFADEAAAKYNFELVKIGAADGDKVLAAIDNLSAAGAKGLVICTPDVRLGPAIASQSDQRGLKLLAVDDRFVNADGTPMEDVHYLGISARKIGNLVGKTLYDEMNARKWPVDETGLCVVTFDELDTAKERTDGATEAILAAGFPKEKIFVAPQKTSDLPGALDAVTVLLTQQPNVKRWLICGMNDSAVMGAVRATEQRQIPADQVIGVGINGTDCLAEFKNPKVTGFYASVLLSARDHGYKTAEMLFNWVQNGQEPAKDTRTTGVLINRDNWQAIYAQQGMTP